MYFQLLTVGASVRKLDHRTVVDGVDKVQLPLDDLEGWRARVRSQGETAVQNGARGRARRATASHNVFISVADAPASTDDLGPLAGVPFAVKDNIYTETLSTTAGSAAFAGWCAGVDAPAVGALRRAGARLVGKTNLHELALGVTSDNATFGAVRNPSDPRRSASGSSGSSGGSAAAVALGVVPFALGTDTGGSMTIPASACGVVGYRPSSGRYSKQGVIHLSSTRDEVGVMATSVADVRTIDRLIRGVDAGAEEDPPETLRLGVPSRYHENLDAETGRAITVALERLRAGGVELCSVVIGDIVDDAHEHGFSIVGFEAPRLLKNFMEGDAAALDLDLPRLVGATRSADVRALLAGLLEHPVAPEAYERAVRARTRLRAQLAGVLAVEGVDALLYPTMPTLPPMIGEHVVGGPGGDLPVFPTLTRHTEAGSFLGSPSVSIPVAEDSCPAVGLTLEGAPGGDDGLLSVASRVARLVGSASIHQPARTRSIHDTV